MKDLHLHNAPTKNHLSPTKGEVVLCEHPNQIVNPKVISLFINGVDLVAVTIQGDYIPMDSAMRYLEAVTFKSVRKAFRNFLMKGEAVDYFVNTASGEIYEPYVFVPCGKCELCRAKKRNHIAIQCQMETQMHKNLPLFVLLTYRDCFKPDRGVVYEDFQLFMKKIRNVYRDMGVKNVAKYKREHGYGEIRFACCGEYGNDDRYSHRPHWHALLWDFPTELFNNDYKKMRLYLEAKWLKGIAKYKTCDNGDAGFYIGKYIAKEEQMYFGNPPVVRHSTNLGVGFVRQTVQSIVKKHPTFHDFKYCDRFDGNLKMLPLTSYYLHKLFPTFSKVPSYIKDAVRKLNILTDLDPVFNIMEVDPELRKCVGYTQALSRSVSDLSPEERDNMYADCCHILQHEYEGKYIDYQNNEGTIGLYLESLFSDLNVDVAAKAYQLKKARANEQNKRKIQGTL